MGAVVSLADAKRERTPHMSGPAKCVGCNHEWTAVAPVGTAHLECPACNFEKGLFAHPVRYGTTTWQCHCGNDLFRIVPDEGPYCVNCGATQDGWV